MRALIRLFWRLLSGVRPSERGRFLYFMALSGLVSLALTFGLAGSEALFLARVGVEWLPITLVAASGVTVFGSFAYALLVGRARNDVLFLRLLVLGALLLGLALLPAARGVVWVYPALLCGFFLAQAVYLNHYWTFTWDFFDTLASKRLFPLFTVGSSVGGIAGGLGIVLLGRVAPPEALIGAWALALLAGAALLRLGRRPLRRWGPLELEESDETSVEGIRGAVRYIRSAPLARWLVVSTLGMVLALFTSQYLYSDLLLRSFPSAEELASFLGLFLAFTNLLEIAVEVWLTPWLIGRLGVASANLVHPVLTFASFIALAIDYRLGPALVARANREFLENALAQPVRVLVYNAIPARFRGRLRLFQEGIVLYAGMAVAGVLLIAAQARLEVFWLCLGGGAMSALYLGANLAVRREYLRTLVERLRAGRLDLGELGDELGGFEVSRLAQLWRSVLATSSEYPSPAELQLPALLVRRGVLEPVIESVAHPSLRVRRTCVEALGQARGEAVAPAVARALRAALADPDASVRLAAVRALASEGAPLALEGELAERLQDEDPEVRAETAAAFGARGRPQLAEMAAAADPATAVAALQRLPAPLLPAALQRTEDPAPAVRAAALECVSRLARPVPLDPATLVAQLAHPDVRVRRAGVVALATRDDTTALTGLVRALEDTSREVRRLAERALAAAGDAAIAPLVPCLQAERAGCVEAAIGALGAMATPASRGLLNNELRRRVRDGWHGLLAVRLLPEAGHGAHPMPLRFLRAAYEDRVRESHRIAFYVLERLEDARVMRTVARVLRFASPRTRADALEVLSNLGDREASQLLVLMLEGGPLEEKLDAIAPFVQPPKTLDEVVAAARTSDDRWLRLAAAHYHDGERSAAAASAAAVEARGLMERLLVLRQVSLFSSLSLEQLEAVSQLMTEARYQQGEVIFDEGDLGSELYLLVEGEVRVCKSRGTPDEQLLRVYRPVSYFGEMAILADEPRSASIVASADSTLLVLGGEQLKELILERPEISFEIFRVLTARVRAAEARG